MSSRFMGSIWQSAGKLFRQLNPTATLKNHLHKPVTTLFLAHALQRGKWDKYALSLSGDGAFRTGNGHERRRLTSITAVMHRPRRSSLSGFVPVGPLAATLDVALVRERGVRSKM